MNERLEIVQFYGSPLTTIKAGDQIMVAVKPICEAIGLDWSAQYRRLQRDAIMQGCVAIMAMQVPGEIQTREVVTIPLGHLNGWLFGVSASRAKPEIRDKLLQYQRECYQVLHDYWTKGAAINPRMAQALPSATGDIIKLIEAVKREGNEAARATLHQLLDQMCSARGIATPPLDQLMLGDLDPRIAAKIDQFWSIIADLQAQGVVINWHRDTSLFAIHYPSLKQIFAEHKVEFTLDTRFRDILKLSRSPAFKGEGDVNGCDGRGRHSLIFKRIDPEVL